MGKFYYGPIHSVRIFIPIFSDPNKRAANFTKKEETLLVTLVKKYSHIVESKKTDSNANKLKNDTWMKISNEFNSCSGEANRSPLVLRNKYLNIKKRSKKRYADEKRYTYGTGGGPAIDFTDSVDETVKEIIGCQMTGLSSKFDSDSVEVLEEDTSDPNLSHFTDFEETIVSDNDHNYYEPDVNEISNKENNWSSYTPSLLKEPLPPSLKQPDEKQRRENTLKTKIGNWAKSKQDLLLVQEKCFLEEHKLKLKQMEEKHEAEIRRQEELHKQILKMRQEEHDIKMSLLKMERNKLINNL